MIITIMGTTIKVLQSQFSTSLTNGAVFNIRDFSQLHYFASAMGLLLKGSGTT